MAGIKSLIRNTTTSQSQPQDEEKTFGSNFHCTKHFIITPSHSLSIMQMFLGLRQAFFPHKHLLEQAVKYLSLCLQIQLTITRKLPENQSAVSSCLVKGQSWVENKGQMRVTSVIHDLSIKISTKVEAPYIFLFVKVRFQLDAILS